MTLRLSPTSVVSLSLEDPDFKVPIREEGIFVPFTRRDIEEINDILAGSTEERVEEVATSAIKQKSRRKPKKGKREPDQDYKLMEVFAASHSLFEDSSPPTVTCTNRKVEISLLSPNQRPFKLSNKDKRVALYEKLDTFCKTQAKHFVPQVLEEALKEIKDNEESLLYDTGHKFIKIKNSIQDEFSINLGNVLGKKSTKRQLIKSKKSIEDEKRYYLEKFSRNFDEELTKHRKGEKAYFPLDTVGNRKARAYEKVLAKNCFSEYMTDYSVRFLFLTYEKMRKAYDSILLDFAKLFESNEKIFVKLIINMLRIEDAEYISILNQLREDYPDNNKIVIELANQLYMVDKLPIEIDKEREFFKAFYLHTFNRFHTESMEKVQEEYLKELDIYQKIVYEDVILNGKIYINQVCKMCGIVDKAQIKKLFNEFINDFYCNSLDCQACESNCLERVVEVAETIKREERAK